MVISRETEAARQTDLCRSHFTYHATDVMSHGAEIKALCEMPAPNCLGNNSLPNTVITALSLLADMFEILFHEKYGSYKTCCKTLSIQGVPEGMCQTSGECSLS